MLIELCEKEIRANAKISDDELKFPRRNLELLGEHGFLTLTAPTEYGGLGQDHVAYAMTCETIARYGCASGYNRMLWTAPLRKMAAYLPG